MIKYIKKVLLVKRLYDRDFKEILTAVSNVSKELNTTKESVLDTMILSMEEHLEEMKGEL